MEVTREEGGEEREKKRGMKEKEVIKERGEGITERREEKGWEEGEKHGEREI